MVQSFRLLLGKIVITRNLAMCLLIGLVYCALPSYSADQSEEILARAFRLSGFEKQIDSLTPMLLAAIPVDMFPDLQSRNKIREDLEKSLGKDFVRPIVYHAVREDFREGYVRAVVDFFDSKIGRKVGRLSGLALHPDTLRNAREAQHIIRHLSTSRLKTLENIVTAERTNEYTRRLLNTLVNGLVEGTLRSRVDRDNEIMDEKLKLLEKNVALAVKRSDQLALTAFAHTYRSLSDDELALIAEYCGSDEAKWFRERVQKGINRAVFQVGVALGEMTTEMNNGTNSAADPRGPTAQGRVRSIP